MRVVHLNPDPGIGPEKKKGAAVHVAALRRAFEECGAVVVALDVADPRACAALLEQALAQGPVDLLYERHALGASAGASFARTRGVARVLEVNAPLLEEARVHRDRALDAADQAEVELSFQAADRVLAVSRGVAAYVERIGVSPERILVRPNGVDTALFHPLSADLRARARIEIGLGAGAFVLGFHGRLRAWHGFELLALAAGRLCAEGRDVHLLCVGEGDFRDAAGERLPRERLHVLDWRPQADVGRCVAAFDALPLTYAADAPCYFSPLKLFEAMACGAVPIVPDLGDLALHVTHGRDGLVYAPGASDELVGCLRRLQTEPRLRQDLAMAAIDTAGLRSWRALASEVLELGSALARQGAGS